MVKEGITGRFKRYSVIIFVLFLLCVPIIKANAFMQQQMCSVSFPLGEADADAEGLEYRDQSAENRNSHHRKACFKMKSFLKQAGVSPAFSNEPKSLNSSNSSFVRPGYYLFLFRYSLFEELA